MADINKTILFELDLKTGKITDETGRVVKSFGDLAKQYDKAAASGKRFGDQSKELSKLQEDQARSAGLAGAAAFELGRTISDLPFGLVAISNNISQLGTLMAALIANAGSLRKALILLKAQLLGPGGLLIAFQIVTAALTFFAKKQKEAEEETEKFSISLILQGKTLRALRDLFLKDEKVLEKRIRLLKALAAGDKNLTAILEMQNVSQEQQINLAEEYVTRLNQLEDAEKSLLERRGHIVETSGDYTDLQQKIIDNNERIARWEKETGFSREDSMLPSAINYLIKQNEEYERTITNLNQVAGALNYIAQEREALNKIAETRTNFIFMTEEEQENMDVLIPKTVRYLNEQISKLEEQRDTFATTTEEIKRYNKQIDELQAKLRLLQEGPLDIVSAIATPATKGIATQNILETLEAAIPTTEEMSTYLKAKTSGDATKAFLDSMFEKMESAELVAKRADMVRNIASSLNDILSAESDRQIAIEKNKTTKLNDQLKARLANEQLSADERDKINQQISRNEAALVERQNKIAKKQFQREKALKIIMALADTASSASKAYLSQFLPIPTPDSPARGTAAAALATAFGLAQVAALSRMKYTEQGMPTPNLTSQGGGGLSGGVQAPSFNVVGSSAQNQLAAAVAGSQSKPVKAYVVSSDVSTAQEMDRKIVEGASI